MQVKIAGPGELPRTVVDGALINRRRINLAMKPFPVSPG